MKKLNFNLLLLLALATIKINAQVKDNISLGPIVGFGHSWHNGNLGEGVERKFKSSFNAGGRIVYSVTPHFGFGLDATFRKEGAKFHYSTLDRSTYTSHANYLRLEPKAYYFFGKYGQAIRPKIGVGPSFGILIGGKTNSDSQSFPYNKKSKDIYKTFDLGLSGSLGFNYRIKSKTWLNVDVIYNHGLNSINKNNDENPKNRNIFLNAGVTFGIGYAGKK